MLTRNRIREIKSLEDKKERILTGLFIAEGRKLITELLDSSIRVEMVYATTGQARLFGDLPESRQVSMTTVSEEDIKRISHLKTPPGSVAVCHLPEYTLPPDAGEKELMLCLDDIQDPGNLGTLLRLVDWFGICHIICSPGTADVYNPKVIQATMGAICRVRTHYMPLVPLLSQKRPEQIPIYGTFLDGKNIYTTSLTSHGIITLGNEGKGISAGVAECITEKITIPDFHSGAGKPESLNVSVAAAVVLSEFRRRELPWKNY